MEYTEFTRRIKSVKGLLQDSEVNMLFELSNEIRGIRLEIGSFLGLSTCSIGASMKDKDILITVDTFEAVGMYREDLGIEKTGSFFDAWKNNIMEFELSIDKNVIPIIGRSQDVVANVISILGIECIELLFIDGDHSYSGIKGDIDNYIPLVRSGGIIMFHDSYLSDINKAINECLSLGKIVPKTGNFLFTKK